jgi:hypothetical protein
LWNILALDMRDAALRGGPIRDRLVMQTVIGIGGSTSAPRRAMQRVQFVDPGRDRRRGRCSHHHLLGFSALGGDSTLDMGDIVDRCFNGRLPGTSRPRAAGGLGPETVIAKIVHNPRLRGCDASDARPDAIMCAAVGALELFGMVKGVVATVEVHAWAMGSDVIVAGMIQPDKTTSETKQILGSIR